MLIGSYESAQNHCRGLKQGFGPRGFSTLLTSFLQVALTSLNIPLTPYLDRVVRRIALRGSALRILPLLVLMQKSSFRRLSVSCLSALRSLSQVARKPSGGEPGDFFKFSWLLKEVGRPGHDFEPLLRPY
jgi:hypothetical protein